MKAVNLVKTDLAFHRDMTDALEPFRCIYNLGQDLGLKYGHLVLPFIPCNFGPTYFCKLVRTK